MSGKKNRIIIVALVVTACIITSAVIALLGSKPFSSGQTVDIKSEEQGQTRSTARVENPYVKKYLILGGDENGLTDTIIVAFCNYKTKEVKLLSIPRDTYVGGDIPTGKINAVYSHAKYPYPERHDIRNLAWYLKTQLGVEPDGYVKISFKGFRDAVNAMGGIPITLPKSLYDTRSQKVVLEAGEHVLDGEMAELFVRFRSGYILGDLGRVEAQKRFMAAAMKRAGELSMSDITALLSSDLMSEVESDLSAGQLLDLAKFLHNLSLENVSDYTLPGVQFDSSEGLACYAVDKKQLLTLLNTEFYGESEQLTLADLGAPEPEGVNYEETYQSKKNNFADLIG
ncbi:MAG TPA: LCP family protein [Oscillospiraceae bacterium]|nr:LCP family protein [Oscillospiraceae bacterium]HPS34310.1 LCP family protein [Oscillospiraceae bacterium]